MRKILIVEDNTLNITITLEALRDEYDVSIALSAKEALELVKEELPDLIILDIVMEGMNGLELCRRLKRDVATRFIPIIFITATYDLLKTEAYDAGGDDFIAKPFKAKTLRSKIVSLLEYKV